VRFEVKWLEGRIKC